MPLHEAGAAIPAIVLVEIDRSGWDDRRYLAAVWAAVQQIERKVDHMTTQQDALNADVASINTFLTDVDAQVSALGEDVQAIALAIQALQNDNPAVDLTGLTAAVQSLAGRQAALDGAVTSATAIVPAPVLPGTADGNPAGAGTDPAAPVDTDPADPVVPVDTTTDGTDGTVTPAAKSAK